MRLLTFQQLCCVRKDCKHTYPLQLKLSDKPDVTAIESIETPPNYNFILHLMPNVNYTLIQQTAKNLLKIDTLPEQLPVASVSELTVEQHGDLLNELHTILLDIHILQGFLVCPRCDRHYPIQQGIPNLRLNEDEVV